MISWRSFIQLYRSHNEPQYCVEVHVFRSNLPFGKCTLLYYLRC